MLEWELAWVKANVRRYDSSMHAAAVAGNITKRYKIKELKEELRNDQRT